MVCCGVLWCCGIRVLLCCVVVVFCGGVVSWWCVVVVLYIYIIYIIYGIWYMVSMCHHNFSHVLCALIKQGESFLN